ncbi:MAG: mechanosensitive ion channel family protein [Clostridiales bacterium]|nr:mechanosensitive ion channel family protein [Clostridiales bacterium]
MDILKILEHSFIQSVLYGALILCLFLLLRKRVTKIIFHIVEKSTKKTKTNLDDILVKVVRKPLKMLLTMTVFYIVYQVIDIEFLVGDHIESFNAFALNFYKSSIIIFIMWVMYNATDESKEFFADVLEAFDIALDKLIEPFISKVFRLIIFVIGIAIVASEWGFDVNGFVAGLGIGGLAFALAAKDTLSNMFGGAVIITEKPFTIGDWIIVGDVEGTVEDINIRSTKIRKFDKSIVTVPNSRVADSNIINFSKREIRRISYELKIHIDTSIRDIKAVVAEINEMLIDHPEINNETIFVNFSKFGEGSFNLFLYYFSNTSDWGKYLSITEDTNFKVMEILKAHDVKLAVPLKEIKMEQSV